METTTESPGSGAPGALEGPHRKEETSVLEWLTHPRRALRTAVGPAGRLRVRLVRRRRDPRLLCLPQLRLEREHLERRYRSRQGVVPDLDDPRTFSEKVQWRKLYDRRQILRDVTEKITARDHVADRVGEKYLIPLLGVGRTTSEIPLEDLPTPYVVKPTHWSGVVVRVHGPSELDRAAIARKLDPIVREPYGIRDVEWAYWEVSRRIMVERLLERPDGRVAFDYKIHVFGGRARFVEVFVDRFTVKKCSIFDRDWRLTDAGYEGRPSAGRMKRPDRLDEMLEVAEALAGDLDYLRTDLYAPGDRIYVGEMTVYPASGFRRIDPPEWDLRWGELWKLPAKVRRP